MSNGKWDTILKSKSFYVRTYRAAGKGLLISLTLNLFLILGVYYVYFYQPIRDFYATSGITPPIKLTPLDEPNYSSKPLLEADPPIDETMKIIPN